MDRINLVKKTNNSISNSNNNGNSSNNINIHGSSSRRSACDRCRSHKLRCVRPNGGNFLVEGKETALLACERCVKAGAECLHTVRTCRASFQSNGYERRRSSDSPSPTLAYPQFSAGTGDQGFREAGQRTSFRSIPAQPACDGRLPVNERAQSHTVLSPISRDTFQHPMRLDSAFSNTAPITSSRSGPSPRSFSMLEKTDTNTGSRPDLPFELSDFESGIANVQSVLEHELHSEVDLAHLFGHSASTSTSPKSFKAVTGTCTTANGGGDASRSSKSPQPSSSKDECLQRLSQLSSKLLVCFSKTENRHVALEDILAYPSPEMSCNAHDGDDQGLHTAKNIIGELLESSQVFLETLEQLKSLEASQQEPQHPYSPSSSEYLYLDSPDEADFLSKESSTPFPAFAPRNSDNDNSHEMATKLSSDKTSRYPCKSANAFSTNVCFSMPTIFTIVTCYMWLFQGYEVVFSAIQESLLLQKQTQEDQQRKEQQRQQCDISSYHYVQKRRQASSSSTPVSRTGKTGPGALCPTVLPNIQFGGFGLDGHPNLQIEMLIHVSSQMLQKIENIMGFDTATAQNHPPPPPPSPCREHGLLDLGCAPTQLYAYLHGARHGAAESPSSGRSALVKDMVKTIRQILSSSHC